jgi:two-component system sensor histidine kinase CpxA
MRNFFVQIFLSFWISTLAIFIAATTIFPNKNYAFPENLSEALDASLQNAFQLWLKQPDTSWCKQGAGVDHVLVFDAQGRDGCGTKLAAPALALLERAAESGQRQTARFHDHWAVAKPVTSSGGRRFVLFLETKFHAAPWWPHFPPLAVPVSALVTFVVAYLLTNPVRALRKAFREFAGGNMAVRLPASRSVLPDWGGADIRTLMIDFNEMADRIQALLAVHKTLLRDVSHELRSPLARLNVALELAREETDEPIQALERAELESGRLNTLIGELLSLSHMESIQEVSHLIEDSMPDLVFEADGRGSRVVHRQRGETRVLGSAEVLHRALENVIRNAIRYTPPGQTVEIETCIEPVEGLETAVARVCDRGPGVPEESLATIFRPFYRLDAARQAATGGFGVGLAIAERAVIIHRGTIRAHNRAGGGLCVELRFPLFRA